MTFASDERSALAQILLEVGPDAPTLCEGWATGDLITHLWMRERTPWLLAKGLLMPGDSVTDQMLAVRDKYPYTRLVKEWRDRPKLPSPLAIDAIDAAMNSSENYIHHEDVRRAGDGPAEPRQLAPENERVLRRVIARMSPLLLRKASVGVRLVDDHGSTLERRRGSDELVRVEGPVGELVLFLFGRTTVARVDVTGEPDAVDRLTSSLGV